MTQKNDVIKITLYISRVLLYRIYKSLNLLYIYIDLDCALFMINMIILDNVCVYVFIHEFGERTKYYVVQKERVKINVFSSKWTNEK